MTNPTTLLGGNITRVNDNGTGDESPAGITRLANGNYVVVWFNKDTTGSGSFGVYVREYHADGKPAYDTPYGNEVLITADASPETTPAVAAWGSGFVIYWANADQDGWVRQYFDNTGGSETAYSVQDNEFQRGFGVATLDDGNHVAFMNNFDYATYRAGDEDGTPNHDLDLTKFDVLDTGGRYVDSVTPVALAGGGYVALMEALDNVSGHEYVAFQVLNDDGTAVSSLTQATDPSGNTPYSSVVALADGGFMVVWLEANAGLWYLVTQRYFADGTSNGLSQNLMSNDREKRHVTATTLSDGTYVIAWMQNIYGDDSHYHVMAQHYSAAGAAIGNTITVETDLLGEDQGLPQVVAGDDGGFTIAWMSADDGDGTGISQRSYTAQSADGDQVVNTHTTGDQGDSVTTRLSDGSYVTVWLDNDSGDLRGQHFDAMGQATGSEFGLGAGFVTYYTIAASGTGFTAYWSDSSGVAARTFDSDGTPTGAAAHIVNNFSDYPYVAANLAGGGHVFVANGYDPDVGDEALFVWSDITQESFTLAAGARRPAITALPNGGYVITWQVYDTTSSTNHAEAQIFTADGTATSAIIDVADGGIDGYGQASDVTVAVTAFANGDFLVIWQGVINGNHELFSQRFDAVGHAVGNVNLVSNETVGWTPGIATLADGSFVVSWVQWTGSDYSIVAQRFYASGMPAGNKFTVNTVADGDQGYPTVHALDNGGFVIGWSSSSGGEDGDGGGVFQKVYDAGTLPPDLGARAGDQQVNTVTAGDQDMAQSVELSDGTYVTVWADGSTLHGQHFNESGHVLGSEFTVAGAYGTAIPPVITALGTGGFAVFWSDGSGPTYQVFAADGSTAGPAVLGLNAGDTFAGLAATGLAGGGAVVNAYIYDFNGTPSTVGWTLDASGTPASATIASIPAPATAFHALAGGGFFQLFGDTSILISTFDASGHAVGSVMDISDSGVSGGTIAGAGLSGGGFVVAWMVDDGDGVHIHTAIFDDTGNWITGEMGISHGSADSAPAVAALDDGGYVVVWQADAGDGSQDIMAERFDASGAIISSPFIVNTVTDGDQTAPTVAALGNGGFVVSWTAGGGQDGSGEGVFQKAYVPYEYSPNLTGTPAMFDDLPANHTVTISATDLLQGYTDFEGDTLKVTGLTADHGTIHDNGDGTYILTPDGAYTGILTLSYTVDDGGIGTTAASTTLEVTAPVVTEEHQVNTTEAGDQVAPVMATLGDGSYVVVWQSAGQDGDGWGVFTQHYAEDGSRIGGEFLVNTTTSGDQGPPTVAALGDGGYVVGWIDGTGARSFYQIFDGNDAAVGGEVHLDSQSNDVHFTALDNGGYAVAWSDGSLGDGFIKVFDSDGNVVQDTTAVAPPSTVFASSVTAVDGGFAVAYEYNFGAGVHHISVQVFDDAGQAVFDPADVVSIDSNARHPVMAALADGGYVIAWQENSGGLYSIGLQRFDATGEAVDSAIHVTDGTFDSTAPTVIGLPDGGYVVVWQSDGQDGDGAGIYAQRYDSMGVAIDGAQRINDTTTGYQTSPSVTAVEGGYVVSWTDSTRDGDGAGIFQKMIMDPEAVAQAKLFGGIDGHGSLTVSTADLVEGYADLTGYALSVSDLVVDNGTVTDNHDGTFTLTPDDGFIGPLTFSYRLDNGHGGYIDAGNYVFVVPGLNTSGTESQVNTYTDAAQTYPATTYLDDGSYVTVWQSNGQDGDNYGIYLQHFNGQGLPLGDETLVNTTTAGMQINPTVTALAGGGYVVGWISSDNTTYTAMAQVYDWDDSRIGGELSLTDARASLHGLTFTTLVSGGFAAAWTTLGTDGLHVEYAYTQTFDEDGNAIGAAVRIDDDDVIQSAPSVTTLAGGGYAVVWQAYDPVAHSQEIYSRIYDDNGDPVTSGELVNTTTAGDQTHPVVASLLATGGYIVVWQSDGQDGDGAGIYSQVFDYCGCPDGAETLVNTTTVGDQRNPAITFLADGGYVIVWQSSGQDGHGDGIFFQRYDFLGDRIGGETQVNDYTLGDQNYPAVTALSDGGFVISWDSPADGSNFGVEQKVYYTQTVVEGDGTANTLSGVGIEADMRGHAGDDTYIVDSYGDTAYEHANEGTDTVMSSVDFYLADNIENLTLTGTASIDGAGNDLANVLNGNLAANTLWGGGGNDKLDGKSGADIMYGGDGNDTYYVNDTNDVASEESSHAGIDDGGRDKVYSTATYTLGNFIESLTLSGSGAIDGTGNDGNNIIVGNAGDNTLWGLGGNDNLTGGAGTDTLYGGSGNDTYVISDGNDTASEESQGAHQDDGGIDVVLSSVSYTLGAFIENLTLTGNSGITGTGNDDKNTITGNSGNNILTGEGGNDHLDGGIGGDIMLGGAGDDSYIVDSPDDIVVENSQDVSVDDGGTDHVYASVDFTLGAFLEILTLTGGGDLVGHGNSGDNILYGNSGSNTLWGLDGNDKLDGKAGADIMYGGYGNDTYYVDDSNDKAIEDDAAGGRDKVYASASFTLGNFIESLTLTGTGNIDGTGNGDNNIIVGNAGNNVLTGGAGNDTLTGGAGADTFVFAQFGIANGSDRILDFEQGTDHLQFAGYQYGFATGHVLTASELTVGTAEAGTSAQFFFNTSNHTLYWDSNGIHSGGLTAITTLSGVTTLSASDFIFT